MINEFDQVVLVVDLPEYHLKSGDVGVVVDITPNGRQYTLEIFNFAGETVTVIPVNPTQVRPVSRQEIVSARPLD